MALMIQRHCKLMMTLEYGALLKIKLTTVYRVVKMSSTLYIYSRKMQHQCSSDIHLYIHQFFGYVFTFELSSFICFICVSSFT